MSGDPLVWFVDLSLDRFKCSAEFWAVCCHKLVYQNCAGSQKSDLSSRVKGTR